MLLFSGEKEKKELGRDTVLSHLFFVHYYAAAT